LSLDQIKKRVQEIARQISRDYHGNPACGCVMENGFIFMADLVARLDITGGLPVCKRRVQWTTTDNEIFLQS